MSGLLLVTAVAAERDAILAARPELTVLVGGVGPAEAAANTAAALAREPVDVVISVGIAGGFGLPIAAIAVASASVFADLGAETPDGFSPVSALGFGRERYDVSAQLAVELTDRTAGHLGTILTVATITGTAQTTAARRARHPGAIAEAMEGAGVASAAAALGVAFAEVRAISNLVGPRDRGGWRIPEALTALGSAVAALSAAPLPIGTAQP